MSDSPGPVSRTIPVVASSERPARAARMLDDFAPPLILSGEHELCPGCGEPAAVRSAVEIVDDLGLTSRSIAVFGIGCYTTFSPSLDVETLQALHGRAPSLATGVKRMLPDSIVFTVQGDGDMVNEGLQEVIHTAARGERITCLMLNNGVFGETGGQMTATTVIGQRTKTTLEGRNVADHGHPIKLAQILAGIDGTAYVARAATNSAGEVARLRRILHRAFQVQAQGIGFSFVEILTMCPTGWFVDTEDAPQYLADNLAQVHEVGVLKDLGHPA
jgi:2-oxoglutarate ferredoxin oxidoreductase subunit beta